MSKKPDSTLPDSPAFPVSLSGWGDNGACGMTMREWFAGMALAGLLSADDPRTRDDKVNLAFAYADDMLAESRK